MYIGRATVSDVDRLIPLFDAYRIFYKQEADSLAAKLFLLERLTKVDSAVFIAFEEKSEYEKTAVGFVQLYPSFSSIYMQRTWILNDLFVTPSKRDHGVGEILIRYSIQFGKETGARSLVLQTSTENTIAQRLYSRLGWVVDEAFLTYKFAL